MGQLLQLLLILDGRLSSSWFVDFLLLNWLIFKRQVQIKPKTEP